MRESTVEDYFCARIKALGGEVRKVKWQGRRGAPDRLALIPARPWVDHVFGQARHKVRPPRHALVELKRPGAAARINQLREHDRLRNAGFEVLLIDTFELVDEHFPLN